MADRPEDIEAVKETIDKERTNLFTGIAALSFLCICLFVSSISLGAYSIDAINERDAMSVALDDQRSQYYQCIENEVTTQECDQDMVSPNSSDIQRDLEGAGFADILYADHSGGSSSSSDIDKSSRKEAFGLLGRIIY